MSNVWISNILHLRLDIYFNLQTPFDKISFFSGPPVISVTRTSYSFLPGSSVTLEVNITSSSYITDLFWEKYNSTTYIYEPIDVQSESRLECGNITCPSLTITDLNKNDNTYFRVKATNTDGTSTGSLIYIYVVLSMYLYAIKYFNWSFLTLQGIFQSQRGFRKFSCKFLCL